MRNYVLTEKERAILRQWIEKGEEQPGYPILKNRILNNFGKVLDDVKLVAEYSARIEDTLSPEAQSKAAEVRGWLLGYLMKAAPELAPDLGEVSEQYQLQAALIGLAMDNAPDAVVVFDTTGKVLYANQEFSRLSDKPESEIIGRVLDPLKKPEYRQYLDDLEKIGRYEETINIGSSGKSPRWIEVRATAVKQSDEGIIIATIRDVTKRKNLETRLKALAEKL